MHPHLERATAALRTSGATGRVRELPETAHTATQVLGASAGHPITSSSTAVEELVPRTGGMPAQVSA